MMSVLPNLIYRFDAITIKTPACCFVGINKVSPKFMWRSKRPRIDNTILKEKNKVGGLAFPDFKTYFKAAVIKTVWYWWRNRRLYQWNRKETPEVDPNKYII